MQNTSGHGGTETLTFPAMFGFVVTLNAAVVAEMLENDIASTEEDTPLAFHPAA